MPGPLIARRDIANAAVSGQPRKFSKFAGKTRAMRVHFYFRTADLAVARPHALGRTPTGWRLVTVSRDGSPGTVYAPLRGNTAGAATTKTGEIFCLGRNSIVLACTTAQTWAEVEVF